MLRPSKLQSFPLWSLFLLFVEPCCLRSATKVARSFVVDANNASLRYRCNLLAPYAKEAGTRQVVIDVASCKLQVCGQQKEDTSGLLLSLMLSQQQLGIFLSHQTRVLHAPLHFQSENN